MIGLKKQDFVMLYVKSMKRSQIFYRDILGLKPTFEDPHWSQYNTGTTSHLGLHPGLKETPKGGPIMGFEVKDIKAARKILEEKGVEIQSDFHRIPGGVVLDITDPNGYTVELIQHTKKRTKQ